MQDVCALKPNRAVSWLFPSIRQPVTLKVPIRARLARIPAARALRKPAHGGAGRVLQVAGRTGRPVNADQVVNLVQVQVSGAGGLSAADLNARGSAISSPLTRRSRTPAGIECAMPAEIAHLVQRGYRARVPRIIERLPFWAHLISSSAEPPETVRLK